MTQSIEFAIEFAWANGCDMATINSAKEELKRIKEKTQEWVAEVYRANEFAVEQTNGYLDIVSKMQSLKDALGSPVAWAKTNDNGDLYDLRLQNNPYDNQKKVIPLFRLNDNYD